ncbi:MAG: alpha/beta hydrolase [Gluconacetobacter diazotrophicus]|nr:alpha/beta hydrolase [Gluconacetobacter diazotrophicus]
MAMGTEDQARLAAWKRAGGGIGEALAGRLGWEAARTAYADALAQLFPPPDGVSFAAVEMGGVPAVVAEPAGIRDGRTLLFLHGGGYASGSARSYRGLAGWYARRLGARVFVPDYRLAPEHRFPAAIDDCAAAYRWLLERDHDPKRLAVSGDSAGGAMVVTVMRRARDAGLPQPVAGVAISPWTNLRHDGESMRDRDGLDPLCDAAFLHALARNFLGTALPTDPDASPVFADVRGLHPVLVQIGENEVMLDDAIRLAAHLGKHRVRSSLEVWPGMFHVWHKFAGSMPDADRALDSAVCFIEQAMAAAAG